MTKPRKKYRITNYGFRWITLTVDFLIFVAAVIYSAFAYQQWRAMHDQVVTIQQQIRDYELEQRPWLTVSGAHLFKPLKAGENPVVRLVYHNSGKTLAQNIQVSGAFGFVKRLPTQVDQEREPPAPNEAGSKAILEPSGDGGSQVRADFALTQEEINGIHNGEFCLLTCGTVQYLDMSKTLHKTKFCFWLVGEELENSPMSYCQFGNGAD